MNRLLFSESELEPDGTVRLSDERHVHIRKVLRSIAGDSIKAGLLGGDCCRAIIRRTEKDETVLECIDWYPAASLKPIDVVLAVPRPIMLNRLWSLLSSMGVRRIDLVVAGNTDPAYVRSHVLTPDVIERQMVDGLQQAANLSTLPDWSLSSSLTDFLDSSAERHRESTCILLEKGEGTKPIPSSISSAVLAIGPERGWKSREVGAFRDAGFVEGSLGDEIYRTELACLAAVAVAKDRLQLPS